MDRYFKIQFTVYSASFVGKPIVPMMVVEAEIIGGHTFVLQDKSIHCTIINIFKIEDTKVKT